MKLRITTQAALAVLLTLLVAAPLVAQDPTGTPWEHRKWASWQVQWENDAFAVFSGSDEFYTNGIRFSWLRNPFVKENPEWIYDFADLWCRSGLCPDTRLDVGYGRAAGQNFYTPTDISIASLIPDDRPYAAWLYYSFLVQLRHDTSDDVDETEPVQNLFELQLGVLGEAAGGKFVQREFHKLIGDEIPQGWDNQLEFEPAVNLIYLWRKRYGNRSLDVVPHWGGGIGTLMTYVNAGFTVRFGRNISDFPQLTIPVTVAGVGVEDPRQWEFFLFAGADGRAVASNVFLDGNHFSDSHRVDKENLVYDLKGGFSLRYRAWRLDYTFVRRSEEFEPQPMGSKGTHDFGSVSLTFQIWPPLVS